MLAHGWVIKSAENYRCNYLSIPWCYPIPVGDVRPWWLVITAATSHNNNVIYRLPWSTVVRCDTSQYLHNTYTFSLPMKTSSNGNIFRVTGPMWGESAGHPWIPLSKPVSRSFGVFFDQRLNKRLSKQPRGRWFKLPWRSCWRHCNVPHRVFTCVLCVCVCGRDVACEFSLIIFLPTPLPCYM